MSDQPKVLLLLGVPDGMTGNTAGEGLALHGNSGIAAALLDELRARAWPVQVQLLRPGQAAAQEEAAVAINAVCEPTLHRRSLRLLARRDLRVPLPTLNPWWVIAGTGRAATARRLAYQVGVRMPLCTVYRPGGPPLAQHIDQRGHRYPILLRPLGEHGSKGLLRLDDAAAAAQAPAVAANVTDFVDFRSADGLYRKYRIFQAGDRLIRRHVLADTQWNITVSARSFMKGKPALIEEEKRWLAQPIDLAAGTVDARILHQFRALQLDFGSVDYGILPGGDIVIFEINACIQVTGSVTPEEAKQWGYVDATKPLVIDSLLEQVRARARQKAR